MKYITDKRQGMGYQSIAEYAKRHNTSKLAIIDRIKAGYLRYAKIGNEIVIPAYTISIEYPPAKTRTSKHPSPCAVFRGGTGTRKNRLGTANES